jgi:predicted metal-dependent peptidase
MIFDKEEFNKILNSLIEYHSIFYKFWKISRPVFSLDIETAAVSFDNNNNCIQFLINPEFWGRQSEHNKKFIIAHECWHVINLHSKRVNGKFTIQANHAMDIVVNESLVKYFNFNRKEIDPKNEYCWLDTCFTIEDNIEPWHNFEYYLNKLNSQSKTSQSFKIFNNHNGLKEIEDNISKEIFNNISKEELEVIVNITEDSEKNSKKEDSQLRGTFDGNLRKSYILGETSKKKKWESIIKKFEKKIKKIETEDTHWLHKNRRISNLNSTLLIPSEIDCSIRKSRGEKIETWFFMDTSGSCWNLADRFFKAAKSLDPEIFDVKYYFFDTKIHPVDLTKNNIIGGGGTSFRIISNFIYLNKKQFPYVWILTDGYGDRINIPQNQTKKWSWFLTENSSKEYIPNGCKIFDLQNFE